MVESSDTNKPFKDTVCETCGKAVGAAVSGSGETWNFKPVCRCSIGASSKHGKADAKPVITREEKTEKTCEQEPTSTTLEHEVRDCEEKPSETVIEVPTTLTTGQAVGHNKGPDSEPKPSETATEPKPTASSSEQGVGRQVGSVDIEAESKGSNPDVSREQSKRSLPFSGLDSGGWASVTSLKTAHGPDLSKAKSQSGPVGWNNTASPKSFSGNLTTSADRHDSFISLGGSDDFVEPPVDDFNRPVAHEVGKLGSSRATSSSANSSGTNLGGSYSSGTNLSGADRSGAYASRKNKAAEEPVDWVPVKKKPPEASKSQFADDAELLDLTHKTETAEEKIKPTTRKSIQEAFRRNRVKTMVIAMIAVVLTYGVYSYASSTGLIRKIGILNFGANSNQPSKKGSGRHSKKNKRVK